MNIFLKFRIFFQYISFFFFFFKYYNLTIARWNFKQKYEKYSRAKLFLKLVKDIRTLALNFFPLLKKDCIRILSIELQF